MISLPKCPCGAPVKYYWDSCEKCKKYNLEQIQKLKNKYFGGK